MQCPCFGIYLGITIELQTHIQDFIKLSKPKHATHTEGSYYDLVTNISESIKIPGDFRCNVRIEMLLLGGRVNEVKRNETTFIHRDFMNHMGMKAEKVTEECLLDIELDNWKCRYYEEGFGKLVAIKRKYDNVFRWKQSIPTNTDISCY
ncbi:33661_t:CDS:2 [Racocetra persica]|uniref:33661_t:CDS:1 n=1 Tax=Racocetra persica TaxID=160502 RepID=A0ACA9KVB7_9GLOM|nr:33661_t:CDS:2 [Racocetra persica]